LEKALLTVNFQDNEEAAPGVTRKFFQLLLNDPSEYGSAVSSGHEFNGTNIHDCRYEEFRS